MELAEVQNILEMQAESDPAIAKVQSAISSPGHSATGDTVVPERYPDPRENNSLQKEYRIIHETAPEEVPVSAPEKSGITAHLTAIELKDIGNEYYKQGKFLDAIDCYEKAIAIDQYFKEAWYNKSIALKKINREDQAKVCWGIYKRLEQLEDKHE
jgi:tetratricopeptide (TPR) repeat protein